MHRTLLLIACAAFGCAVLAGEPAPADPQLDKRVMDVSHELRCLVCQNQTIADSSAPLAVDLRGQVREKLEQGMTKDEIVGYMVERYGEFIRYRPAMTWKTWLLWFGPGLALVMAVVLLLRRLRARRVVAPASLTDEQRARAAALLASRDEAK